jgi:hypothetical protein
MKTVKVTLKFEVLVQVADNEAVESMVAAIGDHAQGPKTGARIVLSSFDDMEFERVA